MAATQKRTPCLRLLLSVTQAEDEHRVVEVLQKNGIPLCFEARAKGTAPSELLDAIGLGGTTRVLTAGLLPRANVPAVFGAINKALSYHKRGAGIAVTLPLTGVINRLRGVVEDAQQHDHQDGANTAQSDEAEAVVGAVLIAAGS